MTQWVSLPVQNSKYDRVVSTFKICLSIQIYASTSITTNNREKRLHLPFTAIIANLIGLTQQREALYWEHCTVHLSRGYILALTWCSLINLQLMHEDLCIRPPYIPNSKCCNISHHMLIPASASHLEQLIPTGMATHLREQECAIQQSLPPIHRQL